MRAATVVVALAHWAAALSPPLVFTRTSRDGPICDRVWLGLEAKGVAYVTEAEDGPDAPRLRWPDGTERADATGLGPLEALDAAFAGAGATLFQRPRAGIDRVRDTNMRFGPIFPRDCETGGAAPYLFRRDGAAVARDSVTVTVEEVDEILEENEEGAFFAGARLSAADCFWGPYLYRLAAQAPCVHAGLFPRSAAYPALRRWFDAMDDALPALAARNAADADRWRAAVPGPHAATAAAVAREAGRGVVEEVARSGADLTAGLF